MMDTAACVAWWRRLQPNLPDGSPNPTGDRGTIARLRRCASVTEAMQEKAAIDLFHALGCKNPRDLTVVGLAAAVLATVRQADTVRFPRAIGPTDPAHPETARVKPLRFRRLMEAATPDERLMAFRRAIGLVDGAANLFSLSEALLNWNEDLRLRWIYEYWSATERRDTAPATAA